MNRKTKIFTLTLAILAPLSLALGAARPTAAPTRAAGTPSSTATASVANPDLSSPKVVAAMRNLGLLTAKQLVQAPDFSLSDLSGQPVRLSQFRGSVVMLGFWATW